MAATPASSGDPLQHHFERCLVQVLVGGEHSGTGFFVAPGKVLTCAHVVDPEQPVTVVWEGQVASAQILSRLPERGGGNPYPYPDLCLLQVSSRGHPCVRLDEREPTLGPPPDHFRAAGFTQVFDKGAVRLTPITCEVVVTGSNLEGATEVTFNGVAGTIESVAPTSILVVTPRWTGKAGPVNVTVRTAPGTSPATPADLYSFTTVTVTSLMPKQGFPGDSVLIVGTGFDPKYTQNAVRFGNARAVVQRGTTSDLYVTAPQGSGTVDVTVTTAAGGTSCATPDSNWTYGRHV